MSPPPPGGLPVISVLVADAHPIVRAGVKALLHADPGLRVCGEAASGPEAVALARTHAPDVALTEASLPEAGGADLVAALRAACPSLKVVVLTGRPERASLRELLAAGVAGYALKAAEPDWLPRAVRAAAAGGTYLDPGVAGWLADGGGADGGAGLSEREVQVVRLIALGYSNKEIAARLALSVKTVETYKARSLEKLGVRSRVAVVRYAIDQGWLTDPRGRRRSDEPRGAARGVRGRTTNDEDRQPRTTPGRPASQPRTRPSPAVPGSPATSNRPSQFLCNLAPGCGIMRPGPLPDFAAPFSAENPGRTADLPTPCTRGGSPAARVGLRPNSAPRV